MVNGKARLIPFREQPEWGQAFVIEVGHFALDGGAMFGVVPRKLWERDCPADADHRIRMTTRCLLLRHEQGTLLVDVGIGDRWGDKERRRYAVRDAGEQLVRGLHGAGVSPGEVTHLVLSHLHFDHSGGLLRNPEGGARPEPLFPRAAVYVQRRGWDWACSPSARDRGSFRQEDFAWLAGDERLRLLEGETEVLPGVTVVPSDGHTMGMQLVKVEGGDPPLLFAADLVPTRHHVRVPWHMGYDLQPLVCIEEKRELLGWAADSGAWLVLEHDPEVAVIRVERDERKELRAGAPVL